MAAPTPTTRVTPPGQPMKDGYRALITFSQDPDLMLWEMEVTPPGYEGGEPIQTATMHNDTWRTQRSRALITLTPVTCRAAYHALALVSIRSMINVEQTLTVTFSTGHYIAFYGFLQNFQPDGMTEGNMPTANCTFVPTNVDPSTLTEEDPVVGTAA